MEFLSGMGFTPLTAQRMQPEVCFSFEQFSEKLGKQSLSFNQPTRIALTGALHLRHAYRQLPMEPVDHPGVLLRIATMENCHADH
ncbi:hypothetical protein [Ciceribacter selenitireducens]|jgi:hypothetical protein|uniref:hypothetical protein n=1 Tax=Ciceribacter selenitireducens TaxID=448181 RepID=UPI0011C03F56|nr:hypothetical protein [Ciceribacter selenitireducens]